MVRVVIAQCVLHREDVDRMAIVFMICAWFVTSHISSFACDDDDDDSIVSRVVVRSVKPLMEKRASCLASCVLLLWFQFVLFCFVLFCFVLFCFVLFCFVLFCFASVNSV